MRVLLNGINALSAGGFNVVNNIVKNLPQVAPEIEFEIILPRIKGFNFMKSEKNINVHLINRNFSHTISRFIDIYYNIDKWCRKIRPDLCFTLGDVGPIKLDIPHVVLLQQAMLLYKGADYESLWSLKDKLKFFYTRKHFEKMSQYIDMFTVQSPVMGKRLSMVYGVNKNKIKVIPSALPFDLSNGLDRKNPKLASMEIDKPIKLLFLAAGYPHKNHIILPAIAEELINRGLQNKIHIFITLGPESAYNNSILRLIQPYSNCITNLGFLNQKEVSRAYKSANALFIPTLVESFGLIYIEAMKYNCPILTSDRDFAHWICKDLAMYFDPLDATSIVDTIEKFNDEIPIISYNEKALKRLSHFPSSWDVVSMQYLQLIKLFLK